MSDRDLTTPADAPLLVDARTAARMLSISPRLLWALTNRGEVPHVRVARRVLYSPADLASYIEAQKRRGVSR